MRVGNRARHKNRGAIWLTFSEADERYLDITRVLLAASVFVLLGIAIHQTLTGVEVDLLALGGALAGLLFGGGAAIGVRGRLEDGSFAQQVRAEKAQDYNRGGR